jgi:uncharacterized protein YecE (DUF72 family)
MQYSQGRVLAENKDLDIDKFRFRDLHPNVFIGTASDRYAGWIGQIYSRKRYGERITRRSKRVGGETFREEVLPVESVIEYFLHFSVLELDFTFYRPLMDKNLEPTQNYRVLEVYRKYLEKGNRLILKVPQAVFAQRLWRGGGFTVNPDYLNPEVFVRHFYEPANAVLGDSITGFIFEQEYQPKKDRIPVEEFAAALDVFLEAIPKDNRYHIEVRTESFLSTAYFDVLAKHGVGQVLSHWTWLPSLRRQFNQGGHRFLNVGNSSVMRLMTPPRVRYEDAYARAFPFNQMVAGMMNPRMVEESVALMLEAVERDRHINVLINNRAGGNAPQIAQEVAKRFLERQSEEGSPGAP